MTKEGRVHLFELALLALTLTFFQEQTPILPQSWHKRGLYGSSLCHRQLSQKYQELGLTQKFIHFASTLSRTNHFFILHYINFECGICNFSSQARALPGAKQRWFGSAAWGFHPAHLVAAAAGGASEAATLNRSFGDGLYHYSHGLFLGMLYGIGFTTLWWFHFWREWAGKMVEVTHPVTDLGPLDLSKWWSPWQVDARGDAPRGTGAGARCPAFPQHDGQMEVGKGAYRDIVTLVTCPKVKDGPESVLETCNGNEGRIAATMW